MYSASIPAIKLAVVIIVNNYFFKLNLKFTDIVIIYTLFEIQNRVMQNDFYVTQFIEKDEE